MLVLCCVFAHQSNSRSLVAIHSYERNDWVGECRGLRRAAAKPAALLANPPAPLAPPGALAFGDRFAVAGFGLATPDGA